MSKLQELIQELCPDGVEYKKLGEVCEMQRGTSLTKANSISKSFIKISLSIITAISFYLHQMMPVLILQY